MLADTMNSHQLNEQAALAADYINTTDRHIFLTGKAGTGKTTFLRYIVHHTYKNTIVAAPTGIAAINAGGVTLHSLLQLPFGAFIPENIPLTEANSRINTPQTLGRQMRFNDRKLLLLRQLELLIIDEVSMLRADLLDCMDLILRSVRRRNEPFGGLQLLFIGDLMQLSPVVRREEWEVLRGYYPSSYFFDARALREHPPFTIELQKIYRQSDQVFIDLLNRLRHNEQTQSDILSLNEQYFVPHQQADSEGYIHLTTHNLKADRLNEQRLAQLSEKPLLYSARIEGIFPENIFPTQADLTLKLGAQVMFIKNDPSGEGKFFNGKIGTVSRAEEEELWVEFEDRSEIQVEPYRWENKQFSLNAAGNEIEEETLGTFTQYPLKLAWAVTVHKSQGLTFEKAILDVSDTFAPGQLYVALSRLTSLRGLRLSSPLPLHPPEIDRSLRTFVESFPDQDQLLTQLQADTRGFLYKFSAQAFGFGSLISLLKEHLQGFNKGENRSLKQQYLIWTQALVAEAEPLATVGDKFVRQVARLLGEEESLVPLAARAEKAQQYFEPILKAWAQRLRKHRLELKDKKQSKGYVQELEGLEEAILQQKRQVVKFCLLVQEMSQGRVPTKDQLRDTVQISTPDETISPPSPPANPAKKAQKAKKKEKKPTALISLELFEEGHSVEEIARQRGYKPGTIFSHLTSYVATGQVDAHRLLGRERLFAILSEMTDPDMRSNELKERLGENFSYQEIQVAKAYGQWMAREGEG